MGRYKGYPYICMQICFHDLCLCALVFHTCHIEFDDLCHLDPIDGTLFSRNPIVVAVAGGQVQGLGLVQGQVLQPCQAAVLVWVKGGGGFLASPSAASTGLGASSGLAASTILVASTGLASSTWNSWHPWTSWRAWTPCLQQKLWHPRTSWHQQTKKENYTKSKIDKSFTFIHLYSIHPSSR